MTAHRGRILHCLRDPGEAGDLDAIDYFDDGVLLVDDGHIAAAGPSASLLPGLSESVKIIDHEGALLVPGFIDCHVHYPQVDVIASYGHQLLDWLNNYTYTEEARFAKEAVAQSAAGFFLDQLLCNGTTTAMVFATVHPHSVDAIFTAARQKNMRLAAGKVMMDRNCPVELQDTPQSAYVESRELLQRWHGQDRLHYAITPRFAPTSSDAQLSLAGHLAAEFPDVHVHTHLAENRDEVAWVAKLFPDSRSYVDVYKRAGLVRERAVFAHGLYLDDQDCVELASAGSSIAFCPGSNLFLGSGLFDLDRARESRIRVGLGTDIGGGTSFSLLRTMSEAYKALHLNEQSLPAVRGLFLATLGAAQALHMENSIGNFDIGKEADFLVLDGAPTALLERRIGRTQSISEELFAQMILGDDRSIAKTYLMGALAYSKEPVPP
ncbi:MAG: guanine deaminase [Gammaproteobacteria bacterium]|nr:guanine deaminase [Gammaproteobacteria bacterium]